MSVTIGNAKTALQMMILRLCQFILNAYERDHNNYGAAAEACKRASMRCQRAAGTAHSTTAPLHRVTKLRLGWLDLKKDKAVDAQ